MAERGINVTRVFDAPRERVWREWTEPHRFADWFGGPEFEVPVSSVSMAGRHVKSARYHEERPGHQQAEAS